MLIVIEDFYVNGDLVINPDNIYRAYVAVGSQDNKYRVSLISKGESYPIKSKSFDTEGKAIRFLKHIIRTVNGEKEC